MPTLSILTDLSVTLASPSIYKILPGLVENLITPGLQRHIAALRSVGIDDLSTLGRLPLSGNLVPQAGVLKPPNANPRIEEFVERATPFSGAFRVRSGVSGANARLERFGGTAQVLRAERLPRVVPAVGYPPRRFRGAAHTRHFFSIAQDVEITAAYWAAAEINFADGTTVIIRQPNRWLVVLANKITVGNNVRFVWEQLGKEIPPQTAKLPKVPPPPTSVYMSGTHGAPGAPGGPGGRGPNGDHAPEIEIWTLEINRLPSEVLLFGQNGFASGKGQDGQDGQDGARGKGFVQNLFGDCESGPGNGGNGGNGGPGGAGGVGGDGGHGGRFNLYAPDHILTAVASGFYIDTKEGLGGPGGEGGERGQGGAGGRKGNDRDWGGGCHGNYGKNGQPGNAGAKGSQGVAGQPGEHFENATGFFPIDVNAFNQAFNKPAITGLSASTVRCGASVTASGTKFTNGDAIFVDDQKAATTFVSDTLLTFTVPNVNGGRQKKVYVKQADGTTSNNATLHVLPTILWVEQDGKKSTDRTPPRFTPGRNVTVIGSGFAHSENAPLTVKVNDYYVAPDQMQFTDSTRLSFLLFRPQNVLPNPDGEKIKVEVILGDGSASSPVEIILDTFVMVVLGDSIAWGQGLREDLKYHSIVAQYAGNDGQIGVYKTVHAHSGAIIADDDYKAPVHGEVPVDHPTITQQVASYLGNRSLVDLVLLNGGINDLGVDNIIDFTNPADLEVLIQRHCYSEMKDLLGQVSTEFPNAKVVVMGYYPIISEESDLNGIYLFIVGLGLLVGALGAALATTGAIDATQKDVIISRCKRFADGANTALVQAVSEVNATKLAAGGNPNLIFVKPEFQASNAIFASESWLWGLDNDAGPADDGQEGGVQGARGTACRLVDSEDPGRTVVWRCERASVGHPNKKGALEYARVIRAVL